VTEQKPANTAVMIVTGIIVVSLALAIAALIIVGTLKLAMAILS
jgi:hypothetical protein